ncbi:hypothetical protein [Nostoc sp.]|uniref:hypothetical protein n=1 Tax=Nostoc sp. TaxID=1180 RepID=UPI002FF8586E
MEPTFAQILGTGTTRLASGATTSTSGLFIPDSVLVAAGLSTPSTATAEGHLVAIVKAARSYLTQVNFDANIDQSLVVANGFPSSTTRGTNNDNYRLKQITVSLASLDTDTEINPGDY